MVCEVDLKYGNESVRACVCVCAYECARIELWLDHQSGARGTSNVANDNRGL